MIKRFAILLTMMTFTSTVTGCATTGGYDATTSTPIHRNHHTTETSSIDMKSIAIGAGIVAVAVAGILIYALSEGASGSAAH